MPINVTECQFRPFGSRTFTIGKDHYLLDKL